MSPDYVAHRGDPVSCTENTLAAFQRAVADGASTVELDVRLTADGEVVVLHDTTTQRIWGSAKPVREQTAAEVTALSDGRGGRIPTLAAVLATLAGTRVLIDSTDPEEAAAAAHVARSVRTPESAPFCGRFEAMMAVREMWPEAIIWFPAEGGKLPTPEVMRDLRPTVWNAEHIDITPMRVVAAHALGLDVSAWTVDDPTRAAELAALGVDSITSNVAALLRTKHRREPRLE